MPRIVCLCALQNNAERQVGMMKWVSVFASLLISLLVSVASIDGQTQAEMNKEAKTEASKTENKHANSVSESEPTPVTPPPPEKPGSDEEREAAGEDSSRGLPQDYAKDYLIAGSTISPDKKMAVIYPTLEAWEAADTANHPERIKDYLVALQPFQVLKQLDTKWPYFQNENHGDIGGEWSDDSSIALITLDAKWGPRDVFLAEFRDGKLSRITNIARKAHDLLLPNYRKLKATRYNDFFDFVFVEDASFKLEGSSRVLIDASAETSPNIMDEDLGSSARAWRGHVKAVWDIAQAKFTSTKISGEIRKRSKETPN